LASRPRQQRSKAFDPALSLAIRSVVTRFSLFTGEIPYPHKFNVTSSLTAFQTDVSIFFVSVVMLELEFEFEFEFEFELELEMELGLALEIELVLAWFCRFCVQMHSCHFSGGTAPVGCYYA
jgi:hypothetical protein